MVIAQVDGFNQTVC